MTIFWFGRPLVLRGNNHAMGWYQRICIVAENESFTLASKKMAISTAQVSRQVCALEKRLNIKLFYRTTRKVSLTEEGRIFYQHCRSVLYGLDAAERAITNLQSKPQGKIKLTAPVTYGEKKYCLW
jgi:DNA-binding transcriptional LysR family regulator